MKLPESIKGGRLAVLIGAALLFVSWMVIHLPRLLDIQNGFIRVAIPLAFGIAVLLRRKKDAATPSSFMRLTEMKGAVPAMAVAGVVAATLGLFIPIGQLEWLGLVLVILACLTWALPPSARKDAFLSCFLLYWAHPMPASMFAFMQLGMQQMSVVGSEWLLHMLNVRAFSDGMILHTIYSSFEIPESCSGMRTATTVVLLALGACILQRQRWYTCILFCLAAIVQALVLNVIRISATALLVRSGTAADSAQFLHDSTGVLVLAAVVLVYLEILWWDRIRNRALDRQRELSPNGMQTLTSHPPIVELVMHHKWTAAAILALLVLASGLTYKSRPYHRAEMIKGVMKSLRDSGRLLEAQAAAAEVSRLQPGDSDNAMDAVRIMILRGMYEEASSKLDGIDAGNPAEKQILRAYCLMGMNQADQAAPLIKALCADPEKRKDPRIAMVLAELGFYSRNLEDVKDNIVVAARWNHNANRVRGLFPYLRLYGQWNTIAACRIDIPHTDASQMFCELEALMNIGDVPRVASLTLQALNRMPGDSRLIEPLFYLTLRRPDAEWEQSFAAQLTRCLPETDSPDLLYRLMDKCFRIARPDLAWSACSRLSELDPTHPALYMSAVRYGDVWFSFRKRMLGMNSEQEFDRFDARGLYRFGQTLQGWSSLVGQIPFGRELSSGDPTPVRKAFLEQAISEFRKRQAAGQLSKTMQKEYIKALDIAGRPTEAKQLLSKIADDSAGRLATQPAISEIYEHRGDWQNVYETLRDYLSLFPEHRTSPSDSPQLAPLLRLCRAQMNLRLGLAAMHTARRTCQLFPNSPQALGVLASALTEFDSPEDALLALRGNKGGPDEARPEVKCLLLTQRYKEAQALSKKSLMMPLNVPPNSPQSFFLPQAEAAAHWQSVSLPSERDFKIMAAGARETQAMATSPFFTKLLPLWLAAYSERNFAAQEAKWSACGRDAIEKATALNQLTLLLCHSGRFTEAREVAANAVELLPDSPVLWRILIGLSNADPKVIKRARQACLDDSEIWLIELVTKDKSALVTPEFRDDLAREIGRNAYTAAALTRAGDFLLRSGANDAAAIVARNADAMSQGLVPAHILALRCALANSDRTWAIEATRRALSSSLQPPPGLYRKFIELKSGDDKLELDTEMVQALKIMRQEEPNNHLWAQMLGYIRFKRGDWEAIDSITQMTDALEAGATNKTPYIIAAEASRTAGNTQKAADFLRDGLKKHPGDVQLLNNLAFTLLMDTNTISDAAALIPELEKKAGTNLHILDTLIVAKLKSGDIGGAEKLIERVLPRTEDKSSLWFRTMTHSAEAALRRGKPDEALKILSHILRYSQNVGDEEILLANRLLLETRKTTEQRDSLRPR